MLNELISHFIQGEYSGLEKENSSSFTIIKGDDETSLRYALRVSGLKEITLVDRLRNIKTPMELSSPDEIKTLKAVPSKQFLEEITAKLKTKPNYHSYLKGLDEFIDFNAENWFVAEDIIYTIYTTAEIYPFPLGLKKYPEKMSVSGSIMKGASSFHRYNASNREWVIGEGLKECLIAAKLFVNYNTLEAGGINNIKNIISSIPNDHRVYLLGENDQKTTYLNLSKKFENVKLAFPKDGKDFADQYLINPDLNYLRDSMLASSIDQESVRYKPLGITGTSLHFYSKITKKVHQFNPSEVQDILRTSLAETGWEELKNREREVFCNRLFKECADVGSYSAEDEYGIGLWKNDENYYFNTGENIYQVLGNSIQLIPFQDVLKNDFLLIKDHTRQGFLPDSGTYNLKPLELAVVNCDWVLPEHGKLFLGFLAQSFYAGALDFRPMLWIMSDRTTAGKTWLTSWTVKHLALISRAQESGKTSAAGFRQTMANFSCPAFIDEFGEKGDIYQSNVKEIMQLLRSAATGSTPIALGTSRQNAIRQRIRFSACLSCIDGHDLISEQDYERMIFIKLISRDKQRFYDCVEPQFNKCASDQHMFITHALKSFHKYKLYLPKFYNLTIPLFKGHRYKALASILAGYAAIKGNFDAGEKLLNVLKIKDKEMFDRFSLSSEEDVMFNLMGRVIPKKSITGDYQDAGYTELIKEINNLQKFGVKIFNDSKLAISTELFSQLLDIIKYRPANRFNSNHLHLRRYLKQSSYFINEKVVHLFGRNRRCLIFDLNKLKQDLGVTNETEKEPVKGSDYPY